MDRITAVLKRLEDMPREQFNKEVMGGIGSTYEFSKLVIGGPTCLVKSDWTRIYPSFIKLGAPTDLTIDEASRLAKCIAKRTMAY